MLQNINHYFTFYTTIFRADWTHFFHQYPEMIYLSLMVVLVMIVFNIQVSLGELRISIEDIDENEKRISGIISIIQNKNLRSTVKISKIKHMIE